VIQVWTGAIECFESLPIILVSCIIVLECSNQLLHLRSAELTQTRREVTQPTSGGRQVRHDGLRECRTVLTLDETCSLLLDGAREAKSKGRTLEGASDGVRTSRTSQPQPAVFQSSRPHAPRRLRCGVTLFTRVRRKFSMTAGWRPSMTSGPSGSPRQINSHREYSMPTGRHTQTTRPKRNDQEQHAHVSEGHEQAD
jgi:hypothetical protein